MSVRFTGSVQNPGSGNSGNTPATTVSPATVAILVARPRRAMNWFDGTAMPATPATMEPDTHDTTDGGRADTPSSDDTSRSGAEARIARPVAVKRKKV